MEFKVIILWVACFSLLTPPALTSVIYTQNLPCIINESPCGVQVPSLLDTGLAVKGAAALMAIKGIAAIALKAAIVKGALIAKGAAALIGMGAALFDQKPVGVPVLQCNPCPNIVVEETEVPSIVDVISGVAVRKSEIIESILGASQVRERVFLNEPFMYEYVTAPRCSSVPIIDEYEII